MSSANGNSLSTASELSSKTPPIIYLIRHGEKPPKIGEEDQEGLSFKGFQRSQAIRRVFSRNSLYNIGLILAQKPKASGKRARPLETVIPLAADLDLTVDTSLDRDQAKEVAQLAKGWLGPGNVLICWEHKALSEIVEHIGATAYGKHVPEAVQKAGMEGGKVAYPSGRFDIIWIVESPYNEIGGVVSENCPGLDDGHKDP